MNGGWGGDFGISKIHIIKSILICFLGMHENALDDDRQQQS